MNTVDIADDAADYILVRVLTAGHRLGYRMLLLVDITLDYARLQLEFALVGRPRRQHATTFRPKQVLFTFVFADENQN